jgi:hypothetical protein
MDQMWFKEHHVQQASFAQHRPSSDLLDQEWQIVPCCRSSARAVSWQA